MIQNTLTFTYYIPYFHRECKICCDPVIWSVFIVVFDQSLHRSMWPDHTHTHKLLSAGLTTVFANVWWQWCLMSKLQLKSPIRFTKLNVLTIFNFIYPSFQTKYLSWTLFLLSATLFIFPSPLNFSLSNTQVFQYSKRSRLIELCFIQRVSCVCLDLFV